MASLLTLGLLLLAMQLPATTAGAQTGADFTLVVSPSSQTLAPGGTAVFLVELGSLEGFASPVALSVSGLPAGVTASFAPATVTPNGRSFLTITAGTAAPLGQVSLVVSGTGGGKTHTSNATANVDFALVPRCLVEVTGVVRETGEGGPPIAGATVSAAGRTALTDATGAYTLTGLALGNNNAPIAQVVTATKNVPAANRIGDYWNASATGVLVCGRTTTVDIAMLKVTPATLTGTVIEGVLAADGTTVVPLSPAVPVQGATATITNVATAQSNAAGEYTFVDSTGRTGIHLGTDNAPLNGAITVSGSVTPPARHRYWSRTIQAGPIGPGAAVVAPPAVLVKQCTAAIQGKVTNALDGSGLGAVAVRVASTAVGVNDVANVVTAADGTFSVPEFLFGVDNKRAPVSITVSRTGFSAPPFTTASLGCGETAQVTIPMTAPTAMLYGSVSSRVVNKDTGQGMAGLAVTMSNCAALVSGDCAGTTAADGTFSFPVPVGTATTASLSGNLVVTVPLATFWPSSTPISVKVGAPTVVPDIQAVPRHFGAVTGVVKDSISGEAVAAAPVTRSPGAGVCGPPCQTNASGQYSITAMPLNTNNVNLNYTVTVSPVGYWPKSQVVVAVADVTKTADFTLVKKCAGGTIRGTVVSAADQQPIAGAAVSVPGQAAVSTNALGQYVLQNVEVGVDNAARVVGVTASATNFYPRTVNVTVSCGSDTELNFGFRPSVTAVSPSSGPTSGGTPVTITGANLDGALAVSFGGTPATNVVAVSDTQVTAVSPPHAAGVVNVTVTTPNGTSSASTADEFTYEAPPAVPTVTGIAPASGPAAGGTSVTITGTNLTGVTAVRFGDTDALFTFGSDTSVTATAPAHAAGIVDVTVTTSSGTSAVNAAARFTYEAAPIPAPTITGIAPASGPAAGGTSVTITGTNLTGATGASFGGTNTTVTVVSDTQATAVTPAHAAGAVDVTITTPSGTSAASAAARFTYEAAPIPAPTITGITPASGPAAGGTSVTITGTNLTGATGASFGGTNTTVTVVSDTQATAVTPAHAAGAVDVTITTPSGTSATNAAARFTYEAAPIPAPAITSITPTSGPAAGGTSVTITGTNLTGVTAVRFGDTDALFTFGSDTSVTATAPAHAAGIVDVTVTTPSGTSAVNAAARFTYEAAPIPAPTITGIAPASGPAAGGTSVTITGTNLTGATGASFGGTNTTVTVVSDTQATAVTPAHAAGIVDVTITTPSGTSATNAAARFTYEAAPIPAPAITSITPTSGPAAGGTSVTITGTNLTGVTAVRFGDTDALFTFGSDTSVTATAPAHAAGIVDVTVTTPSGTSAVNAAARFTYEAAPIPAPTITGIAPASGPAAGGTSVTITGTNLTGATGASFGGTNTTVTVVSDTQATAVTPAHAAGAVDVTITTPTGTSATNAAARFTYEGAPPACTTPTSPSVVQATLALENGAWAKVDLRKVPLPFGLGTPWVGSVELRSGSASLVAPVLTVNPVVQTLPGGCGVRLNVTAIDVGVFPWRAAQLDLRITPGSPAQVSASFLNVVVPLTAATGDVAIS